MANPVGVERETLQATFALGALAAVVAAFLAVLMVMRWVLDRSGGRPSRLAALAFTAAFTVAALSTAWLVHERADKCGPTVSRTLCEPPTEWLRKL